MWEYYKIIYPLASTYPIIWGMNKNLNSITALGQSIWYDNLSRDVLKSGELKSIIESGVRGLTSNPAIFKKAIADSTDYDSAILTLNKKITDIDSLTETMMMEDVAMAADMLRPLYDSSGGVDGCASIELSPYLARDTAKSIEQGRRLWKELNRPNIMIKVPATDEGMPVIRTLLREGINVNVTLIFSCSFYERVMDAYLSGLEDRLADGNSIDNLTSVASFFVSRVDSITEAEVKKLVSANVMTAADSKAFNGTLGIANSKVAYGSFLEFFSSSRWNRLKEKGAKVQRPLWASTGTKNPEFDTLLYVTTLVGANTVNTVPPQTLKDIISRDMSYTSAVQTKFSDAAELLKKTRNAGLPWERMLFDLQVQGVKLFADAYTDLLNAVKKKSEALKGG